MKRTRTLGRIVAIATLALITVFMALLLTGCDVAGDSDDPSDKTALTTAISAANTAKDAVVTDTSAANVPVGTTWVTQAEMTALTTAITAAETVVDNTAATQAEIDAATTAITNATTTFNTAKKDGTATTGTESITVNFWQNENDGAIFASSDNIPITTVLEFTATVTGGYATVQWYIDGAPAPNATTASITINGAAYIGDLGIHRLSVTVTKDGAYYSKEITFTVTE